MIAWSFRVFSPEGGLGAAHMGIERALGGRSPDAWAPQKAAVVGSCNIFCSCSLICFEGLFRNHSSWIWPACLVYPILHYPLTIFRLLLEFQRVKSLFGYALMGNGRAQSPHWLPLTPLLGKIHDRSRNKVYRVTIEIALRLISSAEEVA
jgi:hypothetical protein